MNTFDKVMIEEGYFKPIPDIPVFLQSVPDGRFRISFPTVQYYYYEIEIWENKYYTEIKDFLDDEIRLKQHILGSFEATFSHGWGSKVEHLSWLIPMVASDFYHHNRFDIPDWKEKHDFWAKQAVKLNRKLDLEKQFQIK